MEVLLCAILITIIAKTSSVYSVKFDGTSEPDYVRESYIQMEKSLWEKYVDKATTLTRNERLYKIFNQHFLFMNQFVEKDYNTNDFSVLSRYYEWNSLEPDVKSIHMLFKDHFLYRLKLDLDRNDFASNGFDENANRDLAETVLFDPLWPTNATLEKIQNNIYNQGLYYKAISVRSPSLENYKIPLYKIYITNY